jgi:hypothetical protein
MTKDVKLTTRIAPNARGDMLMALPGNKIVAVTERRWPRLHRLLWEIFRAERGREIR